LLALAVVLAVAAPGSAHAAAVSFAKFAFQTGTPFTFTNNGGTSATLGSGTNTVTFSFTDVNGNATQTFNATVVFAGSTTAPAGSSGSTLDQPLNGSPTTDTIKFTDIDPGPNNGKTLLMVTYTGDLLAQSGTQNASIQSSSNINTLIYSSDFIPSSFFNNPQNFTLALPSDGSNNVSIGPGGFLNSFTSSFTTGQFFTSVVVPEPASVVMFGTGIATTAALMVLRGRKRLVKPA